MIQGRSVRVILTKEATSDDIRRAPGMPEIEMEETAPRFEDAFIDLLGGAGTSESPSPRSCTRLKVRRVKR